MTETTSGKPIFDLGRLYSALGFVDQSILALDAAAAAGDTQRETLIAAREGVLQTLADLHKISVSPGPGPLPVWGRPDAARSDTEPPFADQEPYNENQVFVVRVRVPENDSLLFLTPGLSWTQKLSQAQLFTAKGGVSVEVVELSTGPKTQP